MSYIVGIYFTKKLLFIINYLTYSIHTFEAEDKKLFGKIDMSLTNLKITYLLTYKKFIVTLFLITGLYAEYPVKWYYNAYK